MVGQIWLDLGSHLRHEQHLVHGVIFLIVGAKISDKSNLRKDTFWLTA